MLTQLIKNISSICVIVCSRPAPPITNLTFQSSGFFCGNQGHVVTCAHGLDITKELFVGISPDINSFHKTQNRTFEFIPATIVQHDPINDIALLKISSPPIVSTPPASHITLSEIGVDVGTSAIYLGYPFATKGLQVMKVSSTIISAKSLNENETRQLVLDSTVNDGNSGGPLIDVSTGKIIGIVAGRHAPGGAEPVAWIGGIPLGQDSNISYATGISYALELLKSEGAHD
ncbi:serine protease [Pseudomonas putida]|uniref:S1 family peptidase n=1 Tax=Pseudomonas putida TaxID=303 RepID=UPI0035237AA5